MKNKKIFLVVNPYSGKAKMKTALLDVVRIFSDADFSVEVYPTKRRGDATEKIMSQKNKKHDIFVVCGGDGTLNEVISGVLEGGIDCPIGYIPSGTLNEWSSGLGISRNIYNAAKDIINGKEVLLDIGKFGNRYFSYTASFGAFTSASYSAPQDVKNVLGQAAYFFEGIKSLGNIKPLHLKFSFDGKSVEGDYLFGAVSNSMSVGGILKFNESAVKLNDGLFEVLLIKNPDNIINLQHIVDRILKQEPGGEEMEFFHTSRITVEGSEGIDWTLDGEYAGGSPVIEIENLNKAVKFIVPNK